MIGDQCVFAHGEAELKKPDPSAPAHHQGFSGGRGGMPRRGGRFNNNQGYQGGRGGFAQAPQMQSYTDFNHQLPVTPMPPYQNNVGF